MEVSVGERPEVQMQDSIEIRSPRNKALIEEFRVQPPSQETYTAAETLVNQGLPFVKSISKDAFTHLLSTGKLTTEKEREGAGFEVTYASTVVNKGYGPFTLVLSPNVMKEEDYTPFCVDHVSTYVKRQVQEKVKEQFAQNPMDFKAQDEAAKQIEKQLMQEKYTLTRGI